MAVGGVGAVGIGGGVGAVGTGGELGGVGAVGIGGGAGGSSMARTVNGVKSEYTSMIRTAVYFFSDLVILVDKFLSLLLISLSPGILAEVLARNPD